MSAENEKKKTVKINKMKGRKKRNKEGHHGENRKN
jgi:hypothetical protein